MITFALGFTLGTIFGVAGLVCCMCGDHVRQAPPRRIERRTVC